MDHLSDRSYLGSNNQTKLDVRRNRENLRAVEDSDTNTLGYAYAEANKAASSQITNSLKVFSHVPSVN